MEWYHILIIAWICFHIAAFIVWAQSLDDGHEMLYPWVLPKTVYNHAGVNWFGAIFLYILYFATTPIYAIGTFIYWCCTVGRK
jgi:hypothetical protein